MEGAGGEGGGRGDRDGEDLWAFNMFSTTDTVMLIKHL